MTALDAHVHLGSWPRWGLTFGLRNLKQTLYQYKIGGAVVAPALWGNPTVLNAETLDLLRGEKNLYFFAWVHPGSVSIQFLEDDQKPIRGLKFHPSISRMSVGDKQMTPYLELASQRDWPLLVHCGRTQISWPDSVREIADSYPRVAFILAHLGGNAVDRILETMQLFSGGLPKNVYVESSTARHPDLLARAVDHYGNDKVMYGSDLPFTDSRMNAYCIRLAKLNHNKDFMGGNLRRVLKVS